jgi:hypothetical protein
METGKVKFAPDYKSNSQVKRIAMLNWTQCVIDASMGYNGAFTFCPIEGDLDGEFQVVTGMNYVSGLPPKGMKLVAIIHPDGPEEADDFRKRYEHELAQLSAAIEGN